MTTLLSAASHDAALGVALRAALDGVRGANPLVGAVILGPDAEPLAVGHHRGAGTHHAEVDALAALSPRVDPGTCTMVVTLEPCAHTGRTGACSEAIIAAGIGRVVVGTPDPTPLAGGGAARLAAAGVDVAWAGEAAGARCRSLNHRWFAARAAGRPFVTAKIATTLDGRIAAADGSSRWITGEAARAHGHRLRARADAILVGTGTAERDSPRLTARLPNGEPAPRQPLRVALGTRALADPLDLQIPSHDPFEALDVLAERGAQHLLVEGGPTVLAAFLRADLVDDLEVFTAPAILGSGHPAVADLGITGIDGALRFAPDPADDGPTDTFGEDTWTHLAPRER